MKSTDEMKPKKQKSEPNKQISNRFIHLTLSHRSLSFRPGRYLQIGVRSGLTRDSGVLLTAIVFLSGMD